MAIIIIRTIIIYLALLVTMRVLGNGSSESWSYRSSSSPRSSRISHHTRFKTSAYR